VHQFNASEGPEGFEPEHRSCLHGSVILLDNMVEVFDLAHLAKRDCQAALRFPRKAIRSNGTPEKITIDKSGANRAAIESHNSEADIGYRPRG
jgi:transposase-like protein